MLADFLPVIVNEFHLGIIWENFLKGRKRALWVSVSNDLKYDAERDLSDIGAEGIDVYFLSKMKYAKINSQVNGNIRKGVIFSTYSSLIGESQGGGKYKSRYESCNFCQMKKRAPRKNKLVLLLKKTLIVNYPA